MPLFNDCLFTLKNIANQGNQKIILSDSPFGNIANNIATPKSAINPQSVIEKPFTLTKILQAAIELFTPMSPETTQALQHILTKTQNPESHPAFCDMSELFYVLPNFHAFYSNQDQTISINTTRFSNDPFTSSVMMILFLYMLKNSGFIPSSWYPLLRFDNLMQELELQGPQIAFGAWGYPNHEPNAARQVTQPSLHTPRPIKQMNKGAYTGHLMAIPTFIVVVGAILDKNGGQFILYRDPMNECSQTNPAPIFIIPYERFISKICSFSTIPDNDYFFDGFKKFPWDIKTNRFTFFLPLSNWESEEAKKAGLAEYYLHTNTHETYLKTLDLMKR